MHGDVLTAQAEGPAWIIRAGSLLLSSGWIRQVLAGRRPVEPTTDEAA